MTFSEIRKLQETIENMGRGIYPPEAFVWEGDLSGVDLVSLARETGRHMRDREAAGHPIRASIPFQYESTVLGRTVTATFRHEFIRDIQEKLTGMAASGQFPLPPPPPPMPTDVHFVKAQKGLPKIAQPLGLTPPEAHFAGLVAQMLYVGGVSEFQRHRASGVQLRPLCLRSALSTGWLGTYAQQQFDAAKDREGSNKPALMTVRWFGPNGEPPPDTEETFRDNKDLRSHFAERLIAAAGELHEAVPATDLHMRWLETGPTACVAALSRGDAVEALVVVLTRPGPAEDARAISAAREMWGGEVPQPVLNEIASAARPATFHVLRTMEHFQDETLTSTIYVLVQAFWHTQRGMGKITKSLIGSTVDQSMDMMQKLRLTPAESAFALHVGRLLSENATEAVRRQKGKIDPKPETLQAAFAIALIAAESWEGTAGGT